MRLCVFSHATKRRRENERGENRHAGRSLHNITGVTCSRSQPHTNKQFLELNQAHILCMPTVCRVFWRSQNKRLKNWSHFCSLLQSKEGNAETGKCNHDAFNMSWMSTNKSHYCRVLISFTQPFQENHTDIAKKNGSPMIWHTEGSEG